MLRLPFVLIMLLCGTAATFAQENKDPQDYIIMLTLNAKYQDDAAWQEADKAAVGEHFKKLQDLQKQGKLIIAGRTTVKASTGIIVLKNMTEADARKVIENDNAVQRGIMSASLYPFHTALKEE